ncbi:DUF6088 family protein [Gelidibacter pelagius]|uniref:Type IV toxin-antitoxin system AbiEi family antitoxin domain-containing protein n=1 Tax=Gelidibacter pelagius TaxID=2819985 RepID=A0ABS3SUL3_9FLAO|nr:DUF6088 family protein [Gelidibacter pelagius]MBO3099403.1 type IV toxin-antitoxin system AbiEi family antitoxin domain-containing protein [Gelidibacter pelagius]
MNITTTIRTKVNRMDTGDVFTYDSLAIPQSGLTAAAKALSRLVKEGTIRRYKNGLYYKPKTTVFGEVKPREEVLLQNYLFEDGKQIAYVTGVRLYNQLGLTSQISNVIKVASKDKQIKTTIGNIKVKPSKSYVEVTKNNVPLLQILDVIKDFNSIPDFNKEQGITFLEEKINNLSYSDKNKMVSFAKKYPPKVRALVGAILENLDMDELSNSLKDSINYLSLYEFGITKKILPTIKNWNVA